MSIELKPCPFCGEAVSVNDIHFGECKAVVYDENDEAECIKVISEHQKK